MSPNVEYLGSIQQDVGLTAGAKILGDRMYVTSGKNLSIYDISEPAAPKALGGMTANIAWENEEVPTNGEVLAVASDFYSVGVPECVAALAATGCVQFFDVRDPANVKQVGTIPTANHTVECALDCQYFYGRAGTIIDARGILEGTAPKVVGNWIDALRRAGRRAGQLPPHPRVAPGGPAHGLPAVRGDLDQRRRRRVADAAEGALHGRGGEVRALRAVAA